MARAGLFLVLIITFLGCSRPTNSSVPPPALATRNRIEFTGKIVEIAPLASVETAERARWKVQAEVLSIQANHSPTAPQVGSRVTFFLHSVVLFFGADKDAVVGNTYRLAYKSDFQTIYHGEVEKLVN
jgi:hypothetical protein